MTEDKWKRARQESIESVKQILGGTIVDVQVSKNELYIKLDSSLRLTVGSALYQNGCSDWSELEFDINQEE